jgi:methylthioribose-1-phosphate isomerase
VLTHCNAGWLATVDWGTALAPVYKAHEAGVPVHVWVDETRPRAPGASLTAWELGEAGVPHTLVTDTMAGHLMKTGRVDLCLVGSDRTTARGDVCNKIGTYLVALAAHDNGVPFYACVPTSSIDFTLNNGSEIPIEERSPEEVTHVRGQRVAPARTQAANFAFDVTPARLVTGIVTEHGVFKPSELGAVRA